MAPKSHRGGSSRGRGAIQPRAAAQTNAPSSTWPPSAFANEADARSVAHSLKMPFDLVCRVGVEQYKCDPESDPVLARCDAMDWLELFEKAVKKIVRQSSGDDSLRARVFDTLANEQMLPKKQREIDACAAAVASALERDADDGATGAAEVADNVDAAVHQPKSQPLADALRLEVGESLPPLEVPPMLLTDQRRLVLDAYRAHEQRVAEAFDQLHEAQQSAQQAPSSDALKERNELVDTHKMLLLNLLHQTRLFQEALKTVPDATETGRAVCARECRRLLAHLPAVHARQALEKAVADPNARAAVIVGETGSGKSTQVPQYLADYAISNTKDGVFRGNYGRVICTQPRRLAALALHGRVTEEWGNPNQVGYDVGADRDIHILTDKVVFMTEFAFLQRVRVRPGDEHGAINPKDLFAIVVDEAHERSVQCDLVIGHVYRLINTDPSWMHVKLLISSATIDEALFTTRLAKSNGQPADVVKIPGRTFPVDVRHRAYIDDDNRDVSSSSDSDDDPAAAALTVPTTRVVPRVANAVLDLLTAMDDGDAPIGDVLCFLPGAPEASDAVDVLKRRLRGRTGDAEPPAAAAAAGDEEDGPTATIANEKLKRLTKITVLELSGRLTPQDQRSIVTGGCLDPTKGVVRIICGTPVAETSITIPTVTAVVDSGLARVNRFDPKRRVTEVAVLPISKQSAVQRKGRAGRTQPGMCVRLYAEEAFDAMSEGKTCALMQMPLEGACLSLLHLTTGDPLDFHWLEPPDPQHMISAIAMLESLGAVCDVNGKRSLTTFGAFAARLAGSVPDVRLAFVLFEADDMEKHKSIKNALDVAIVAVVAASCISMWWTRPPDAAADVDAARRRQAQLIGVDELGDLVVAASILGDLVVKKDRDARHALLRDEFVNRGTAFKAIQAFGQLRQHFTGKQPKSLNLPSSPEEWATKLKRIVLPHLVRALQTQVAVLQSTFGHYTAASADFDAVLARGSLVNAKAALLSDGAAPRRRSRHASAIRLQARAKTSKLPQAVLYLAVVEHTPGRPLRMSGIVPLAPFGVRAQNDGALFDGLPVSEAVKRSLCELSATGQCEVVSEPVPTLFAMRWRGREIEDALRMACSAPSGDSEAMTLRCFVDRDEDPPLLRVICSNRFAGTLKVLALEFLRRERSRLCDAPYEQPVVGHLRVLLGKGGKAQAILSGDQSFSSVRLSYKAVSLARSPIVSKAAILALFPDARSVEVRRQANDRAPAVFVHFANARDADSALSRTFADDSTFKGFSVVRRTDPAARAVQIETRIHVRMWLVEEFLPDGDGSANDPKERPLQPTDVSGLGKHMLELLTQAGGHSAHVSYKATTGAFDATAFAPPARVEELRAALSHGLDIIEGRDFRVTTHADFTCRIGCGLETKKVLRQSVEASLPRGVWLTPNGIQPWFELVSGIRHHVLSAAREVTKLARGHPVDPFAFVPVDGKGRAQELVFGTINGMQLLRYERNAGLPGCQGAERGTVVDRERREVTLFSPADRHESKEKQLWRDISTAAEEAIAANVQSFSRTWRGDVKARKRKSALKQALASCSVLLATSLDEALEYVSRPTITIFATEAARTALDDGKRGLFEAASTDGVGSSPGAPQAPSADVANGDHEAEEDETCVLCAQRLDRSFTLAGCQHRACTRCLEQHFRSRACSEGIVCPVHACAQPVAVHDVLFIARDVLLAAAQRALATHRQGRSGFVACPNDRCAGMIEALTTMATCAGCNLQVCVECARTRPSDLVDDAVACLYPGTPGHKRGESAADGDSAAPAMPQKIGRGPMAAVAVSEQIRWAVTKLAAEVAKLDRTARFDVLKTDAPVSLAEVARNPLVRKHLSALESLVASCDHGDVECAPGVVVPADEATAIRAYTVENPNLYKPLNSLLRAVTSQASDEYKALRGYMHFFLSGFRKLPPPQGDSVTVYRGFDEDFRKNFAAKYTKGKCVSWKAISSTSTKKSVAEGTFARSGGIVFEITLKQGCASIAKLSALPNEAEIIVPPRTPFQVDEVSADGSRVWLSQIVFD